MRGRYVRKTWLGPEVLLEGEHDEGLLFHPCPTSVHAGPKEGKELLLLASFAIEQDIPRAMHGIESDAL